MSDAQRSTGPLGTTMDRLRKDLDNLLETAWSRGEQAWDRMGFGAGPFEPALDVVETPESLQVHIDLPGIDPQSIDVSLVGNMLTIKGERIPTCLPQHDKKHLGERRFGSFTRSVSLPIAVDPDRVQAQAHLGVVTITLTKSPSAQSRKIQVS